MEKTVKEIVKMESLSLFNKVKQHPIKSIFFGAIIIWLFKKLILKPIFK